MKKIIALLFIISYPSFAQSTLQWHGSRKDELMGIPTLRPPTLALYNVVLKASGCKIMGVQLPTPDQSTWSATYDIACTQEQIAAGNEAITNFKGN